MTHEEAINIVKTQYPHDSVIKEALGMLIPELRESEDERIRKWLADYFSSIKKTVWIHRDITCEQILAWLEKQKEPEWSDIDREMLDRIIERGCCELPPRTRALTSDMVQWLQWMKEGRIAPKPAECIEDSVKFEEGFKTGRESGLRDGQKYVLDNAESYGLCKPAEWSEEDENVLKYLHDLISWGYAEKFMDAQTAHDMRVWINERLRHDTFQNGNSRPKSSDNWKPSEEHLSALLAVFNDPDNIGSQTCQLALTDLYEQLKKL